MKIHPITSRELVLAEAALFGAIILQIAVGILGPGSFRGPHYLIIAVEIALALIVGLMSGRRHLGKGALHRPLAFMLLAVLSLANIISFAIIASMLIGTHTHFSGIELLVSALAIFITNIIVFAFWYWEIDSPGLSGTNWSKHDYDFQFTQQEPHSRFADWQPGFADYMYLSVTNAINFAPADAKPLTVKAKALMGTQAMLSVFTLALVVARSVSILGQ